MIDQGRSWTASTLTWNRSPSIPEEASWRSRRRSSTRRPRGRASVLRLLLFLITIMMIALILKHHPLQAGRGGKGK